jgi:hypothetical protein
MGEIDEEAMEIVRAQMRAYAIMHGYPSTMRMGSVWDVLVAAVKAGIKLGAEREREACANIADSHAPGYPVPVEDLPNDLTDFGSGKLEASDEIATAIRARGGGA